MDKFDKYKKYIKLPSLIIIVIVILIMSYICYDFFIYSPKYRHKIDNITEEVNKLKKYLDKKIPEIDSTINITNKQYEELKNN
jgi:hypothetical protein